MAKKNDDTIKLCLAQEVEVSRAEWMELFGEAITSRQIVPEVALEKTLRQATKEGMVKYKLESLVIH